MNKKMIVKEGIVYTIGEFDCPICKTHHYIRCKPVKENPNMRPKKSKHWIE